MDINAAATSDETGAAARRRNVKTGTIPGVTEIDPTKQSCCPHQMSWRAR